MTTRHLKENIDLIAKHEQDFLERRTKAERMGDAVAGLVGSLKFVAVHIVFLVCWIGLNTAQGSPLQFDPPPYPILDLIFAFEAILLVSFILMRQSRIGRRSEERKHLELQVLLITEKEITTVLALTQAIAHHMGLKDIDKDAEIEQMAQATPIDEVAENIRKHFPTE
jgi:uncharacterized membrane protein